MRPKEINEPMRESLLTNHKHSFMFSGLNILSDTVSRANIEENKSFCKWKFSLKKSKERFENGKFTYCTYIYILYSYYLWIADSGLAFLTTNIG